ncbi:hypothetical protein [Microbacterium elymi]|uniref:Uncharacterized protein n=1 Tax=Microbacterium elymi TaxID=2909587 RepID=A0ABY5NI04_9MICO|nr:hypothetical protein [Microbacterium elymi]UUT34812.1 hypothetical protein L2X98_30715 [Microbacterium elymi]
MLAVLWLLFGLGSYFLQFAGGSAATLARMIPSPLRGGFFGLPTGWAVTVYGLTVVLIVLAYTVIATWFARGGRVTFAAGWLAAVLTGFVVGGMLDLGDIARSLTMSISVRGAASATGSAELVVFWAFIVGWIPALTVTQRPDSAVAQGLHSDGHPGTEDHPANDARRRPPALTALTVIAAVIAVALPIAAQSAHAASQAELERTQAEARAQAEANADPNGAAPKDPQSTGIPVPTVAESAEPAADGSCAFDDSTMMAPPSDAATGHRVQPLQAGEHRRDRVHPRGLPRCRVRRSERASAAGHGRLRQFVHGDRSRRHPDHLGARPDGARRARLGRELGARPARRPHAVGGTVRGSDAHDVGCRARYHSGDHRAHHGLGDGYPGRRLRRARRAGCRLRRLVARAGRSSARATRAQSVGTGRSPPRNSSTTVAAIPHTASAASTMMMIMAEMLCSVHSCQKWQSCHSSE